MRQYDTTHSIDTLIQNLYKMKQDGFSKFRIRADALDRVYLEGDMDTHEAISKLQYANVYFYSDR